MHRLIKKEKIMAIDKEAIEMHIRGILEALGEDPNREGLVETPARVAGIRRGICWN